MFYREKLLRRMCKLIRDAYDEFLSFNSNEISFAIFDIGISSAIIIQFKKISVFLFHGGNGYSIETIIGECVGR